MPLMVRLPFRSPVAAASCARCFSTGKRNEDIMDILSSSTSAAQRHPSVPQRTPQRTTRQPSLASRMAAQALPANHVTMQQMKESDRRASFQKQMHRRWQPGDVYAPHDLSGAEQKKWKTGRNTPQSDAFDTLGINPVNEYKNFTIMSEYMTEMGRIKHSKDTGLRPKNQRKIAKAIRRAIGLGLMPSVHRHPLVMKKSSPMRFL